MRRERSGDENVTTREDFWLHLSDTRWQTSRLPDCQPNNSQTWGKENKRSTKRAKRICEPDKRNICRWISCVV
eukprot:758594-Hanusia_phi.AAC.1